MYGFFVTIIVIASVLITIAVLLQNSKGGGLASNFGAGNQTFGVRQAADILEKSTWILAAVIILFSIGATAAISSRSARKSKTDAKSLIEKKPAATAPAFPINGTGEAAPAEETPAQQAPAE